MNAADVFGVHAPFAQIVYRSAIVYVAIIGGMRLTGRRQLGQMTPFDLVLILLIANAVQNAMVGSDVTILGGLAAAATLLVTNQVAVMAAGRFGLFRRALEGTPVLLVHDGAFVAEHVRREGISEDLVLQAIREHGIEGVSGVESAVLEIDGSISIIPRGSTRLRSRRRVRTTRPGGQ